MIHLRRRKDLCEGKRVMREMLMLKKKQTKNHSPLRNMTTFPCLKIFYLTFAIIRVLAVILKIQLNILF